MLPKVFQLKFVDVTTVGSIVYTEVAQIRMMFIVDFCDLNVDVFNDFTGYHVLSDYGPHGGYLKMMQSEVEGFIFHSFHMTQSRLGTDLEEALMFQRNFTHVVCSALDARFCDRFLYANPSSYLNSPNALSVSDVSCSFGAIDTNGNDTQIS